jgi:hypothetical protein
MTVFSGYPQEKKERRAKLRTFPQQFAAFNAAVAEWDELNELYASERRRARVIDRTIRVRCELTYQRFLLLEDMSARRPINGVFAVRFAQLRRCLANLRHALIGVPPAIDRRVRQRVVGDFRIHLVGDEPDLCEKAAEVNCARDSGHVEHFDDGSQQWLSRREPEGKRGRYGS